MNLALPLAAALALSACSTILPKNASSDCACGPGAFTSDNGPNRLVVGADRFIDLAFEPAATGLFIGNPRVLRATIAKSGNRYQLALQPLRAGESSLEVLNARGEMRYQANFVVTSEDLSQISNQLGELLRGISGLSIKTHKTNVVLDGELSSLADFYRVASVASDKHYAEQVLNLTTLSPKFFNELAPKIEDEIRRFAPDVNARMVNSQIWLEGHVANQALADRAVKVANLELPTSPSAGDPLEDLSTAQKASARVSVQSFIVVK